MDPLTLLLIAQAFMGFMAQAQAASAQTEAIEQQAQRQEADRARQVQETQRRAAAEANAEARRRTADLALFDAVAGEYGGGNTVNRARAVREVAAGERMATLRGNESAAMGQLGFDGLSIQTQANSRLASIEQPDVIGLGLQIGAAYAGRRKPKSPTQ